MSVKKENEGNNTAEGRNKTWAELVYQEVEGKIYGVTAEMTVLQQ